MSSSTSADQQVLANKLESSSSSESSEDEEEAKKIAAAVGDSTIIQLYNGAVSESKDARTVKEPSSGVSKSKFHSVFNAGGKVLKSNRPVDKNEDDKDNVLHTTPEFRAHIGKQLFQMLEKKLSDSYVNGFWSSPKKGADCDKGILLFSDSKKLFTLQSTQSKIAAEEKPSSVHKQVKDKRRKISTSSSSSDSSDDEMIKSCVVTVSDIHKENERLSAVEVTTGTIISGLDGKKKDKGSVGGNTGKESEKTASKMECIDNDNKGPAEKSIVSENGEPCQAVKKKKKKKKKKLKVEDD